MKDNILDCIEWFAQRGVRAEQDMFTDRVVAYVYVGGVLDSLELSDAEVGYRASLLRNECLRGHSIPEGYDKAAS